MQQFHTTTVAHNKQTLSYVPAETVTPPEHALTQIEAQQEQQEQQEQSETVERLLAAMERDTQRRRKWNETTWGLVGVSALVFYVVWGMTWLFSRRYAGIMLDHLWYVQIVGAIGWISGKLFLDRKSAADLIKLEDVRCVGALTDIWGAQGTVNHGKKIQTNAKRMLTKLLPRMKASDAALLKEPQRSKLRAILANNGYIAFGVYQDAAFMLSILKAFEQVGDWKSLPYVQQLAQEAKNPELRAAAKECLPYLEALAEKYKPGEDLLRASSAGEAAGVAPDSLLRASGE